VRTLALVRWEIVQTIRGLAPHMAITLVSLASAGLVAVGVFLLDLWSPFPSTPAGVLRTDNNNSAQALSLLGEYRGGVVFMAILAWLVLLVSLVGPAFTAGAIVRDRRSGRLDRVLADASRADAVALAKLLAGLIPIGIVLLGVGPSTSFAWLVGGMATREAIASVGVFLIVVVLVAAIGLLCSAVATTEVAALVASYVAVAGLLLGPLVAGVGLGLAGFRVAAGVVLSFDPLVAMLSVQTRFAFGFTRTILPEWTGLRLIWTIGKTRLPVWAVDVLVYALLAVVLVWLTSVIIEPLHPLKTWRVRRAPLISR